MAENGEGCFGAAAYDDTAGLPDAALQASLGCGNPAAVAALEPGEMVLDLGPAAASTCCCRPGGSARPVGSTAWTPRRT